LSNNEKNEATHHTKLNNVPRCILIKMIWHC